MIHMQHIFQLLLCLSNMFLTINSQDMRYVTVFNIWGTMVDHFIGTIIIYGRGSVCSGTFLPLNFID